MSWAGYTRINNAWGCWGNPQPQPWFPNGWPPGFPPPPGPPGPQFFPGYDVQEYTPGYDVNENTVGYDVQEFTPGYDMKPFGLSGQIGDTPVAPLAPLDLSGQIGDTPTEPMPRSLRARSLPSIVRGDNPHRRVSPQPQRPQWRVGTTPDRSHLNLHAANYPTPGFFFDASNPQGRFKYTDVESFIRAALGSALAQAGMPQSLAMAKNGEELRKALADVIASGLYNDGLYGTTNVGMTGGRRWVAPHGRGINWEPHHGDARRTIASGESPQRTTELDGSRLPQFIEAKYRPLVYVPELDLQALQSYQIVPVQLDPPVQPNLNGVRFPGGVGHVRSTAGRTARDWWDRP